MMCHKNRFCLRVFISLAMNFTTLPSIPIKDISFCNEYGCTPCFRPSNDITSKSNFAFPSTTKFYFTCTVMVLCAYIITKTFFRKNYSCAGIGND